MSRCRPAYDGFTYLWMLLLVALIGVGLTVAVEVHATAAQRERELHLLSIGRQFQSAIARYYESRMAGGRKEYPATLNELLLDARTAGVTRHLRKVFVDPMTGKADWGLVQVGGRIVGVHSLSDQMPIKQDGFAPEHMVLRGKQRYAQWLFVYPPHLLPGAAGDAPEKTVELRKREN